MSPPTSQPPRRPRFRQMTDQPVSVMAATCLQARGWGDAELAAPGLTGSRTALFCNGRATLESLSSHSGKESP